ncbi:glutathione S-transferase family protein [Candidatus Poribacteria bacterium]|nr:glutathione S-transferase family protein [Candidatus Poribacteria bacterium]
MLHHTEKGTDGQFNRQEDSFRSFVRKDSSSEFPAVANRYHLYASLACPWAHRVIIVRKLKGLEKIIGMTIVDPVRDEKGWRFTEEPDPINNFEYLKQAYIASDPGFDARVTVPVLWDCIKQKIVNNSEDDLTYMMNTEFEDFSLTQLDLHPENLRTEIEELERIIYENINNGVYQAGFATTQSAYELAVEKLFETLDFLEDRLSNSQYLFGSQIVECDWRLFVTLIRFDAVYHGHFKCNQRRIIDYPNLYRYMCELYQLDGISSTVNFDHIKRHYYMTHPEINPTRIVPIGPDLEFTFNK